LLAFAAVVGIVVFSFRAPRVEPIPVETIAVADVHIAAAPFGAEIFIDGRKVGSSEVRTSLQRGSYTVVVSSPGYESQNVPLVLGAEPREIEVNLRPVPLDLHIVTDQLAGQVWLDKQPKGNLGTPEIRISGISPGVHELRVRSLEGEVTTVFSFRPGQLPVPVSLPSGGAPAVLFAGSFGAKSHLDCNCAPAVFRLDGSSQSLGKGGMLMDLPEGEHPAELAVMGGRKLSIRSSRVPVATVAVYWGQRSSTPQPSADASIREINAMISNRQYGAALVKVRQMMSANPNDDLAPVLQKRLERLMVIDP
jgi:hypothetical protein